MKDIFKNLLHIRVSKKTKTIAVALVITITGIFLTRTFLEYYEQIQNILFAIPPAKLIISFILFLGYFYMRALSWRSVIYSFGASISKIGSFSIWFFSEATRYIPGNIWSFASRAYLARQKKVSRNVSILILPVEVVVVVATTTLLSSYAIINKFGIEMIKNLERLPVNLIFYAAIVTPLVLLLLFLLLHKTIKRALKKLLAQDLNLKPLLTALIFQLIGWSFYSLGTIILIDNLAEGEPLLLFSSALLAWLIGYLSIIIPMGLGVRESAFVLLAGQQIGIPQALLVAVLGRAILIVAELTNLALWAYFSKRKQLQST